MVENLEDQRPRFESERTAAIPQEWERAKWLVERERSINSVGKGLGDFAVRRLYSEAHDSYILGVYGATIWASLAAAERLLRVRLKAGERMSFADLTKHAESVTIISTTTGATLREQWELSRNAVVHGKRQFAFGHLGMRERNDGVFEAPEGKFGYVDTRVRGS